MREVLLPPWCAGRGGEEVQMEERREEREERRERRRSRRLSRNSEDEDTEGSTSTHERCFYASFKIYLNPDSR